MARLLLVDDEPAQLRALQRSLRGLQPDLDFDLAVGGAEALALARAHAHDVVVADLHMPGLDGLALLREVARWQPLAVRLLLTGTADFATAQRAVNEAGVFRYLTKPWDPEALRQHIGQALDEARRRKACDEQASAWQASLGLLTPEEIERRRLEAEEPGITHVDWEADGAVRMPALDADFDTGLGPLATGG